VDGMAYQTLDIILLHEKWKIGPYGTCIKILSFQKWPVKNTVGSSLVPTPDMMRRQSLSYWGVGEIPPSEKIVSKASIPDATELVDRIVVNHTHREQSLRDRKKKKEKEDILKITKREKSGRGFKYLVAFNEDIPKWVSRSNIPKRFSSLVDQFDKDLKDSSLERYDIENEDSNNFDDDVLKDVLG